MALCTGGRRDIIVTKSYEKPATRALQQQPSVLSICRSFCGRMCGMYIHLYASEASTSVYVRTLALVTPCFPYGSSALLLYYMTGIIAITKLDCIDRYSCIISVLFSRRFTLSAPTGVACPSLAWCTYHRVAEDEALPLILLLSLELPSGAGNRLPKTTQHTLA